MKTGEKGLELIKHFEGLQRKAYLCPAGVWTIGYGHTGGVQSGDEISTEQADLFLLQDIAASEYAVNRYVTVPLTQHQFDALVSFTFNLGSGNLHTSTLLKKLNAGDYSGAAEEFQRWVNAGGKKMAGLVRRREAEKSLFMEPDV
ncbi:lysozyme [Erwinia persicina]|uniref:Lysozyme n=1 Tax=Erwinia persicina TaxID=55211 RepID=A0A4U3EST7_9GAMM|nr:lysozyme [Erwinia persicina]MBD8109108.1 lysozyme [Erwinia persicina]MBD8170114.1 lysozyme [Erwinia persicina]MBD8212232.1 lysozyme [Erwinia persicina]TKJ83628.1 lysozyme [Erwinia persicina]